MKIAHSAEIRVFCGEGENEAEVLDGLRWLVPFNMEEQKIEVKKQSALGFDDRKIMIFEVLLEKDRHVKPFLDNFLSKLQPIQKQTLLRQLESRIDEDANFFVRLEKDIMMKNRGVVITDGGNCYHIQIKVAAYPSTKYAAVNVMRELLERA